MERTFGCYGRHQRESTSSRLMKWGPDRSNRSSGTMFRPTCFGMLVEITGLNDDTGYAEWK